MTQPILDAKNFSQSGCRYRCADKSRTVIHKCNAKSISQASGTRKLIGHKMRKCGNIWRDWNHWNDKVQVPIEITRLLITSGLLVTARLLVATRLTGRPFETLWCNNISLLYWQGTPWNDKVLVHHVWDIMFDIRFDMFATCIMWTPRRCKQFKQHDLSAYSWEGLLIGHCIISSSLDLQMVTPGGCTCFFPTDRTAEHHPWD